MLIGSCGLDSEPVEMYKSYLISTRAALHTTQLDFFSTERDAVAFIDFFSR